MRDRKLAFQERLAAKDVLISSLRARLAESEAHNDMLTGKADDYWKAKLTAESRLASALEVLTRLCAWAESAPVRAVEASAAIHGVKYRPEDVAIWGEARALAALLENKGADRGGR